MPIRSSSAGPVDTTAPGTSNVSDDILEKAAAALATRTGDSDVESNESGSGGDLGE